MKLSRFLLLLTLQISQCPKSLALDKIPPKLNQQFVGKDYLSVMLTMEHSVNQVFNSIKARRFANSDDRTTAMVAELQAHTANSQKPVLDHLSRKISLGKITSFWITNRIAVEKASLSVIQELLDAHGSSIKDIGTLITITAFPIRGSKFEYEYGNFDDLESDKGLSPSSSESGLAALADGLGGPGINPQPGGGPVHPDEGSILENWGISNIGADKTREAGYDGRGKVIGIMDSGVRWTHEALRNNMRPTYNWFDTINGTYYSKPVDNFGHGTHCAGIAAGRLGIGVAPGSQWISCRIMYGDYNTNVDSILCGQWMLCPTLVDGSNPDCSMRPDVVSNSWGGQYNTQADPFYDDVIAAWQLADITPVFAIGNSGPQCASAISPGDAPGVISVGCTNINNYNSMFSSNGPTSELHARIKPELCAPGRKIYSASYLEDTQYLIFSGTSMACPHMAGAVAVYKQKHPDTTFDQMLDAFRSSAYQWRMSDDACNYKSTNITEKWPNNYCGYGILRLNGALGITGKPSAGSGWNN